MGMKGKRLNNYAQRPDWEQLYVLTKHWRSDLDFFTDEVNFLKHLVEKYFLWLTQKENVESVHKVFEKILVLEKFKDDLIKTVTQHQSDIKLVAENPVAYDVPSFREQHARLEEDMADYVKSFRNLKKEIFQLTGNIIESEKLGNLLQG